MDLTHKFFSISIRKEDQKQFSSTWDRQQHTLTALPQGRVNFPTLCPNIVLRNLGHLDILQNIILVHSVDDSMFFGPEEQEVASVLEALVIYVPFRWEEKNTTKIQWLTAFLVAYFYKRTQITLKDYCSCTATHRASEEFLTTASRFQVLSHEFRALCCACDAVQRSPHDMTSCHSQACGSQISRWTHKGDGAES
ncbi:uncharacterized protein [Equus przewalskii]|uniref:Reverse transcriptase domain-containing protein n=3 Tax=Equus TaxID=9789 RepID=A0A9L0T3V1_HORSE